MDWNYREDLPIYSQLVDQLKREIVSGKLCPGTKLLSVREMALEAEVNPNTMQRALTQLEQEGLVYTQRTSGRFVTDNANVIKLARVKLSESLINSFVKDMLALGFEKKEIVKSLESFEEVK